MSIKPYQPHEIEIIKARYLEEGAGPIAKLLDRDQKSVRVKAYSMGLVRQGAKATRPRREWTDAEDLMIRKYYPEISGRKKGAKNMAWLARQIGVGDYQIRNRVYHLGLVKPRMRALEWSEKELEILEKYSYLSMGALKQRLKRAGFASRSEAAISVARSRYQFLVTENTESYSATSLSRLLGVSDAPVRNWIKKGWLKAKPRSDVPASEKGGVGDRFIIRPNDVRKFIVSHIAHINLATVDRFWFVDLLAGSGDGNSSIPVLRQERCGSTHEAAGGMAEYGCAL